MNSNLQNPLKFAFLKKNFIFHWLEKYINLKQICIKCQGH